MRRSLVVSCVAAGALVSSVAFAARPIRVPICHLDAGVFALIQVIQAAVPAHLARHGDVYPGSWWPDADGDGYGDPGAEPSACPQTGLVANDDDCDEGTSSVSPGAEEVCADGIDQDCDGEVDDGCAPSCPCFTRELIVQHFDERPYANGSAECTVVQTYDGVPPSADDYDYTLVWFTSWEFSGTHSFREENYFESIRYGLDTFICVGNSRGNSYDQELDETYDEWTDYDTSEYMTGEQHAACEALLVATAAELGLTCQEYSYD